MGKNSTASKTKPEGAAAAKSKQDGSTVKAKADSKASQKAANKAELMAFVANITTPHASNKSKAEHEEREKHGSRGSGNLLLWCSLALLTPIAVALAMVFRSRSQQKGELVSQDDSLGDGFGAQDMRHTIDDES